MAMASNIIPINICQMDGDQFTVEINETTTIQQLFKKINLLMEFGEDNRYELWTEKNLVLLYKSEDDLVIECLKDSGALVGDVTLKLVQHEAGITVKKVRIKAAS